ncbi:hypothetical protein VR611_01040 [Aquirufa nivalisilvae]
MNQDKQNIYKQKNFSDNLIGILIFFYWCMYENVVFLNPRYFGGIIFEIVVFAFKFLFPFFLLFFVGIPSKFKWQSYNHLFYTVFYSSFIIWSLIPTILGGDVISWIKIIPIFVFYFAFFNYVIKNSLIIIILAKLIVSLSLFALIQYILIHITGIYYSSNPDSLDLTGPFGLFGATQSLFHLPGINIPIIRLCGFWKEPSNASGVTFASFFLCKYLASVGENKIWNKIGFLCLLAGLLTLSNAGYFALGGALFLGFLLSFDRTKISSLLKLTFFVPIIGIMLWLAFFSRTYVANNSIDNPFLLAVSGVRNQSTDPNIYDPTNGRLDLISQSLNQTIGIGLQVTGENTKVATPTNAPLFWLVLAGYPGMILLLFRDSMVLLSIRKKLKVNPGMLFLVQAYFCIILQQLMYGVWMDPNYIIFTVFILAGVNVKSKSLILQKVSKNSLLKF